MGEYDIALICLNGHIVNEEARRYPQHNKIYCPDCGEKTISECPLCKTSIQGYYSVEGVIGGGGLEKAPGFCHNCGKPYPWTESKIVTAIQILAEFGNLSDDEKKTIEQDINNIARDVPQSELSANRIKRILKNCGMVGYEIIMEFASRTAAKVLKNP